VCRPGKWAIRKKPSHGPEGKRGSLSAGGSEGACGWCGVVDITGLTGPASGLDLMGNEAAIDPSKCVRYFDGLGLAITLRLPDGRPFRCGAGFLITTFPRGCVDTLRLCVWTVGETFVRPTFPFVCLSQPPRITGAPRKTICKSSRLLIRSFSSLIEGNQPSVLSIRADHGARLAAGYWADPWFFSAQGRDGDRFGTSRFGCFVR
jgi:hypothetical protein